jgi:hypothetical protein
MSKATQYISLGAGPGSLVAGTPLPEPKPGRFPNFETAQAYSTTGFSAETLIAYVQGELNGVTPGAFADYVEEGDWPVLLTKVKALLAANTPQDTVHMLHREKYGGV